MAYSTTPNAGIDLTNIVLAADVAANKSKAGPLLAIVSGSDGCLYQWATAGGAIPASTALCSVSSAGVATSSGGNFTSPATAMASGDYGWFKTAQLVGTAP